jgi:hypothetical protein
MLIVNRSFVSQGNGSLAVPKRDDLTLEGAIEHFVHIRASYQYGVSTADIGRP